MIRAMFALGLLALASLACSMSGGSRAPATSVPTMISFATATATQGASPSATVATVAPTATTATTSNNSTSAPRCTVRTDWPIYTVASGDSLGVIAQRTGSDVNTLVTANCLTNANSLSVGQQLRVPRAPATYTPPTVTTVPGVTTVGAIAFDNYVDATERMWMLEPNAYTTVRWLEAPRGYAGVAQFLLYVNGSPVLIGSDEDMSNGADIVWLVPANVNAKLEAVFFHAGSGTAGSKSYQTTVTSGNAPTASGFPVISSYLHADAGNFQLRPGETIQIRWFEVPANTASVKFYYVIPPSMMLYEMGSVTLDADGAIVSWVVPQSLDGRMYAVAYNQDGYVLATSHILGIYSAAQ